MNIIHALFLFVSLSLSVPSVILHYLIRTQDKLLQPSHYFINLMWINKTMNPDQAYIYPSEQFTDTITSWAQKNPDSSITVWFDSLFVNQEAIQATENHIADKMHQSTCTTPIKLQDIRTLQRVRDNPEVFSPKIPIYFRVDILRGIIVEETVKTDQDVLIYADFDIQPINKNALFDHQTLSLLEKYHFVMAYANNKLGFENGFQMFTYNKTLSNALSTIIVEENIDRAKEFLKDLDDPWFRTKISRNIHAFQFRENVFYSYPIMYAYFMYDDYQQQMINHLVNAKILMTQGSPSAIDYILQRPIPTKKVPLPKSKSIYSLEE